MAQPTSFTWSVVTSPPIISAVNAIDLNTIDVIFSEEVVVDEANNAANYSFSGGLTVRSVENVSGSSQRFRVTTSDQTAGASYTVTASNIHDISGNLI